MSTTPDAVAEDLLKKLPGVEVDRSGNIKAQGEDVQKVLVDGKEFFSSDPTVATKNLPADAISKVQVFDKKSDETELTGIDDGSYQKTLNIILKDGRKNAYFGDVTGGYAKDNKFQAGAKLYRFNKKYQFAALGMLNNINKYGFSFKDYIDFNVGLQSMMSGGGITLSSEMDAGMPVDFGRPVTGLVTSGATGLNYMYEARENNRFNISYLGSGANKFLSETSSSTNFTQTGSFIQNSDSETDSKDRANRLNFGWKNRIDSLTQFNLDGNARLTTGDNTQSSLSHSFVNDYLVNGLSGYSRDNSRVVQAKANANYLRSGVGNWKLFKAGVGGNMQRTLSSSDWNNITSFYSPENVYSDNRFLDDQNSVNQLTASVSATRKISKLLYLVPSLSMSRNEEDLDRKNGLAGSEETVIDSLSPHFKTGYSDVNAGLSLKRNTKKSKLSFTAGMENGLLSNGFSDEDRKEKSIMKFLPSASWRYDYRQSRSLSLYYESLVNTPQASQLLPTGSYANPLNIFNGNRDLLPETMHVLQANWMMFDQFSQTSVFANLNGTYTQDKINLSQNILPDLSQKTTLVNVKDDYRAGAGIDFSTPLRKIGLNLQLSLNENWSQGISLVNDAQNQLTNYSHSVAISFYKRKNEKLDVSFGSTAILSDARYSIMESLNKKYLNINGWTEVSYTPFTNWHFAVTFDVTRYDARSFGEQIDIPLLKAEATYFFLKNRRGSVSIECYDILDKNKGLERISQLNYLMERRSNVISRYLMLTLKYRLTKAQFNSGISVDVKNR